MGFGNGVTASLSFEDGGASVGGNNNGSAGGRGRFTADLSGPSFGLGSLVVDNKGTTMPDVVGALRIDQAWGYAQIAAALHDASGGYYLNPNSDLNGHPGDKLGWAVTGGFTLNDILGLKGDQFGMQAAYSQGAAGYVTRVNAPMLVFSANNNVGTNWITDGVFDTGTSIQLTTVWGINGFYQHFWNPRWRTSLYGGYVEVDYNSTAATLLVHPTGGGSLVCGVLTVNVGPLGGTPLPGSSCSPNSSWWQVGTRTQWNPHPDLDIGIDVLWSHLNTAYKGQISDFSGSGARPPCLGGPGGLVSSGCRIDDQDVLSVMFRIQRNFLP
jgi:hypothetical protein